MNSTITVEFKAIGLAGSGSGFTCCELGFENNPKKLQKGGFPHMQKKGCTCIPSGMSPCADAGSFREFRVERSEMLEPMTLVSPVGMGRSLMQAHRSDWVKVSLSLAPNLNPVAAMYYGFSVFHCMTPPLAQGGLGLGTYMGPPVWKNSCGRPGSPA